MAFIENNSIIFTYDLNTDDKIIVCYLDRIQVEKNVLQNTIHIALGYYSKEDDFRITKHAYHALGDMQMRGDGLRLTTPGVFVEATCNGFEELELKIIESIESSSARRKLLVTEETICIPEEYTIPF